MRFSTKNPDFVIRRAEEQDAALLLFFISQLAEYEKLSHEVVATEQSIKETLFGARPYAEALIGEYLGAPVAFAIFFHNYSTFLGRPGIYIEDIYVQPEMRGKGFGKIILSFIAKLACERGCGRLEWSVLDWNEPAIAFYKLMGAISMDERRTNRLTGEALGLLAEKF